MLDNINNYIEETKPLFRMLRTEAFRFIIVRYNHYSLINRLKDDLSSLFPDRPQFTVNAIQTDYRSLVNSYYSTKRGFFFIENFEEILENPEIYSGLNQRRDKLALYPIALIVFVSFSMEEMYARQIMEKMPDLWSFRSLLLDLKVEDIKISPSENWHRNADDKQLEMFLPEVKTEIIYEDVDLKHFNDMQSTLGGLTDKEKEKELNRLVARIKSVPNNEINFLKIAYSQITKLLVSLRRFDEAIEYYGKIEKIENDLGEKADLGTTYNDLGFVYSQLGKYDESLKYYLKSEEILTKENNIAALGTTFNNIGGIHSENGNWEMAYNYYKKAEKLFLDSKYEAGLGAVYNNIGGYYIHRQDWKNALPILLKSEKCRLSCGDSEGLEVTYFNLGFVYSKIGDLKNSLESYIKSETLLNQFKDIERLKIVYLRIAEIYSSIKALDKAIIYYKKLAEIEQKVGNKIGYGNALNYLGIVTSDMGDFNTALKLHLQAEKIRYKIGDDSGLVQTLYNIGMEWLRIKNPRKATDYFTLAGYLAKEKKLNSEMNYMNWAINEIIKKKGQDEFMKEGEKLYKSWIKHLK